MKEFIQTLTLHSRILRKIRISVKIIQKEIWNKILKLRCKIH